MTLWAWRTREATLTLTRTALIDRRYTHLHFVSVCPWSGV